MVKNKALAELNREKTAQKVLETLGRLKKRKKTITLSVLAKEAGISRQTLYNRSDLKAKLDEVNSLIQDSLKPKQVQRTTNKENIQERRIQRLQEELAQTKDENVKLLDQNVLLTEANLKLQKQVADLEERLYNDTVTKLAKR